MIGKYFVSIMVRSVVGLFIASLSLASAGPLLGQSLNGSSASLTRQNRQAHAHDFTYLETRGGVERFVRLGLLVPVEGNADFVVAKASFAFARPAVEDFLERLGAGYRATCGRQLIVTSLTRPEKTQPRNASERSVHPTGMATDIRRSNHMPCRGWLEATLLYLEDQNVLEATEEQYPPHYHVAVFPDPFTNYVEARGKVGPTGGHGAFHLVRSGDTLGTIADLYNSTVRALMRENGLRSSRIYIGQVIRLPEDGQ